MHVRKRGDLSEGNTCAAHVYRHIRNGWYNKKARRAAQSPICVSDLPNSHVRQLSQRTWF